MKDYWNKYYIIFGLIAVSILYGCKNKSSERDISCNDEDSEEYVYERLLERQEAIKAAEKHEEDDGFVWYSYEYNGKMGIVNEDGEILIWDNYDGIYYSNEGPFLELSYRSDKGPELDVATQDCVIKAKGISAVLKKSSFEDRREGIGDKRYWYRVIKYDHGIRKVGAYSKSWDLICPPIFYDVDYYQKGIKDVEYFYARMRQNDEIGIVLNFRMDGSGLLIENEKPIFLNYYVRKMEFDSGAVSETVFPIIFYNNYLVFDGKICSYYRSDSNYDIYKYIPSSRTFFIYVDKNHNIELKLIDGERHLAGKEEWIQMKNQHGEPIYNIIEKEAMQKWVEFEQLE